MVKSRTCSAEGHEVLVPLELQVRVRLDQRLHYDLPSLHADRWRCLELWSRRPAHHKSCISVRVNELCAHIQLIGDNSFHVNATHSFFFFVVATQRTVQRIIHVCSGRSSKYTGKQEFQLETVGQLYVQYTVVCISNWTLS